MTVGLAGPADAKQVTKQTIYVGVNDHLRAIRKDILPAALNAIEFPKAARTTQGLASFKGPPWGCYNKNKWKVKYIPLKWTFGSSSSTRANVKVKSGGKVDLGLSLSGFEYKGEIRLTKKAKNTDWCKKKKDKSARPVWARIKRVSGDLNVTLSSSGSSVTVKQVRKIDLRLGDVDSNLEGVADWAIAAVNWFMSWAKKSLPYRDMDGAIDYYLSKYIGSSWIRNEAQKVLNNVLKKSLSMKGATKVGSTKLKYTVKLSGLTTKSSGRLTSKWGVTVSTSKKYGSCGGALEKPKFKSKLPAVTTSDFDAAVPFAMLSDLFYAGVRLNGSLCKERKYKGYKVKVWPTGKYTISGNNKGVVTLKVPFKATLYKPSPSGIGLSSTTMRGDLGGTIKVQLKVATTCNSGLQFSVKSVKFTHVTGSVTLSLDGKTVKVDATTFMASIAANVAGRIKKKIPSYTIAPKVIDVGALGNFYLAYDKINSNKNGIRVGLDLRAGTKPSCEVRHPPSGRREGGGTYDPYATDWKRLKIGMEDMPRDDEEEGAPEAPGDKPLETEGVKPGR
jgi:hypothetical protein